MPRDFTDKIIMLAIIGLVAWAIIGLPILYATPSTPIASNGCVQNSIGICFVAAISAGKIFGFAEFVQAFAILVLVYTISDVRYRFRVATAPYPLLGIAFWGSALIGIGTILTDLWFERNYPIPWFLASQPYWQLILGVMFLFMVLLWLWFAFVRPPVFGTRNAVNFARALFNYLLQGAERDLPVIAAELERSARAIVLHVNEMPYRELKAKQQGNLRDRNAADIANDVLLLIANRKFCRHIVASAPGTAIALFRAMSELRKYRIPIGQFASNLSTEALLNKDSILYHEDDGYYSGYFGYIRPFTNAIYGNFDLVEALTEGKSPLDIDYEDRNAFDAKQLSAYTRAVLTTFKSYLNEDKFGRHSYALYRAFDNIKHACFDLYKLNETPLPANAYDIENRLRVVVDFIDGAIRILHESGLKRTQLRHRGPEHRWRKDFYDHIVDLMFDVIGRAASVKTGQFRDWQIQYSMVWSRFVRFDDNATRRLILFKLRRRLYENLLELERYPNFVNAAIAGYCLNVTGLTPHERSRTNYQRPQFAIQRKVVCWTQRRYLWLVRRYPRVAEAFLMGNIHFDKEGMCIVKTYERNLHMIAPTEELHLWEAIGPIKGRNQ